MKKMTMLQIARKFQENAIKSTEHPILDKILAKTKQNKEIENSQKDIKSGYLGEEGDDVLVYTTNQTNNRIREEWKKRFYERFGGEGTIAKTDENCILIAFTKGEVIDFIDELLKSQEHKLREELVEKISEKIENMPERFDNEFGDSEAYLLSEAKPDIINIINNI